MNVPVTPTPGTDASAEVAIATLEARFMAGPLATIDEDVLQRWQPKPMGWFLRLQQLLAQRAGLRSLYCEVDGHRINYWTGGNVDGPTMLLLHGFGASRENWLTIAPLLAKQFHLLIPDLPGFGRSSFCADADYSLAAQASRVAQLLRHCDRGPALVVGSSMGGAISAQLAARYPGRVAALCLMNAAGAPAERLSVLESGLAAGVNHLAPSRLEDVSKVFDICLHRRHRLLGRLLAFFMAKDMVHRYPVNRFLFKGLATSLSDTWACLPDIAAPTLALWGDSDRVLDMSCGSAFVQRIDQCQLTVLPGVGPLPMIESPGDTAQLLRDFWASNTEFSL
ncbi:alpha/beta fold hydrolase [Spongiibacter tropicus]|uniref:alpha/beta fold hydrolase n=1 Tax=Spongiibacter tropicus TaxID=454602 RepID=UPI0023577B65|nr:alpha/beta hydrolase [Spongiibacter tropicus]